MEHNRDCDTIGEVNGNSKFADFPFTVDNKWQDSSVRVTNTTESPYLIKKNTQIAEFSVVTSEQSEHIKQVDAAILSGIPQGDPDLTAYLNELLRTNKPGQQNNTFWCPTPENPRITPQYRHESWKN